MLIFLWIPLFSSAPRRQLSDPSLSLLSLISKVQPHLGWLTIYVPLRPLSSISHVPLMQSGPRLFLPFLLLNGSLSLMYCSWKSVLVGFFCTLFAGIQEYSLLTTPQALSHQHQYWASSNAGVLLPGHSPHGSSSIPQSSMDSAYFPECFAVPFTLTDECLCDFQHHSSTTRLKHPRFYLVLVLVLRGILWPVLGKPFTEGCIGSGRSVMVLF